MIQQTYNDIVTDELIKGAIWNYEFEGFHLDYSVLHCLLRIHKPKSVFEVGTSRGTGTNIICNSVPYADVYSLDMPYKAGDAPLYENGKDLTGINCKFPFTLLRGNSLFFKFAEYPCEFYYVDANHTYQNVLHETKEILRLNPKVVAYHDTNIKQVMEGIIDGMNENYELYQVVGTRISYLLKK